MATDTEDLTADEAAFLARKQARAAHRKRWPSHVFPFEGMADVVPPGTSGPVQIEHFTLTASAGRPWQGRQEMVDPGTYAMLKIGGRIVMSDTQHEQRSNLTPVVRAKGDVLIAGLGLGMILVPILRNPAVTSVHVIEQSQDVIDLVKDPVRQWVGADGDKLTVHCFDIHRWMPLDRTARWDLIYFDIWADYSLDDYETMKGLHRKLRRFLKPDGLITSWKFEELKYEKRSERSGRGGWPW